MDSRIGDFWETPTSAELNRSKQRLAGTFLLALTLLSSIGVLHLLWFLRNGYRDFTVFHRVTTERRWSARAKRRNCTIYTLIAAASVTCILVGYHAIIHDLTLLLPVVLMLFSTSGAATQWEMRMDLAVLVVVYASLFMGS